MEEGTVNGWFRGKRQRSKGEKGETGLGEGKE